VGYQAELVNLFRNRNAFIHGLHIIWLGCWVDWGCVGAHLISAILWHRPRRLLVRTPTAILFQFPKPAACKSFPTLSSGRALHLVVSSGALYTGYISGRFGRKKPFIISGLVSLIGSSQVVALRVLYFGQFLGGFGLGTSTALVPSYVSKCTPKAIRGRCSIRITAVAGAICGPCNPWVLRTLHVPPARVTTMVDRTTTLRRSSEEFSIRSTRLCRQRACYSDS